MGQQGKENSCEGGERLAASWAPDGIALEVKLLSAPQRRFGGGRIESGGLQCVAESQVPLTSFSGRASLQ